VKIKDRTTNIHNLSGVYQMKYKDFPLRFVGQTGRTLRTRYNEHTREFRINGQSSKFAQHILDTANNYDTMDQTMKILYVERKKSNAKHIGELIYIYIYIYI
jgi:hypothetical protein